MARDFMGLNCKDPMVFVKQEVIETSMDSEFPKGLGNNGVAINQNVYLAGTINSQLNSKAFGAPGQMTIFYGGTVNVYEDISPEKAQAIMFLAGHGNIFSVSEEKCIASPMSITSHPMNQTNEITNKVETPKITIMSSAVPQARKASLTRFLEMRKERVLNSSPYRLSKKSENPNPEAKYV